MQAVKHAGYFIPAVCIGGINHGNIQRVLTESGMIISGMHGAAVVSAIVADADPKLAARRLKNLIQSAPVRQLLMAPEFREGKSLALEIWEVARDILHRKPVSHNMTNLVLPPPPTVHVVLRSSADHKQQVVQNFAANVALCMGASPIMANYGQEAVDLAKLGGALVINMGTVTPEGLANYIQAIQAYNQADRPVVFDPVGCVPSPPCTLATTNRPVPVLAPRRSAATRSVVSSRPAASP